MPGAWAAVVVIAAFLLSGLKVRREYERAVVFRLGRLVGSRGPGVIYVIPGIEKAIRIDLRTITMDIPSQDVIRPAAAHHARGEARWTHSELLRGSAEPLLAAGSGGPANHHLLRSP